MNSPTAPQDIIRGTVTDARVEKHPELDNLHTIVITLRVRETLKGAARETYTFRQYIWDLRDRSDVAGYRKGQELLLLMNGSSRYGLTSPVGLEQGRFRIQRDRSGREVAMNGARQCAPVRRGCRRAGQARRAHAAAGEPGRQASQRADRARRARGDDPRLLGEQLMRRQARALAAAFLGALAAGLASAGGPLILDESGTLLVWGTAAAIAYRTDGGPLSNDVSDRPGAGARREHVRRLAGRALGEHPLQPGRRHPGRRCLHRRRREHGGRVQRRGGRLPRRQPEPDHLRRGWLAVRGPRRGSFGHRLRRTLRRQRRPARSSPASPS